MEQLGRDFEEEVERLEEQKRHYSNMQSMSQEEMVLFMEQLETGLLLKSVTEQMDKTGGTMRRGWAGAALHSQNTFTNQ